MSNLYPLRFEPVLRRYLWGGRRLETVLGKSLAPGNDYAESWEVVDHGDDQSLVAAGPLAGETLGSLVGQRGAELLGRHHPRPCFPLLFKFLDARRTLSVQVHPDDARAARSDPPDLGKTEAWVVLAAEPGSLIYAGLKPGTDRQALARELERGTTDLCLHRFEPQVGDCVFLPAGVVHSLGQGVLVAEVQQSSDTTYRVFDWNRVDADGKPRQLHIQQALEAIDYQAGPVEPQSPQPTQRPHVERLVACEHFVLDRWQIEAPQPVGGDDRFHIVAVLQGTVLMAADRSAEPLTKGQNALVPAATGPLPLTPRESAVLLDVYLP